MKKMFLMSLLAGFAVSAGADSLVVLNADFQVANLANWDVTEPDGDDCIYSWNSSLAYKDSVGPFYVEQNLSTNNLGLATETSGNWTVGFDYGWRASTLGGNAEFVISVMDVATDAVLASSNLVVVTNSAADVASFSLGYDTNAVTAGNPVKLRIERIDPFDVGDTQWASSKSTAFIDNITVVVAGYTYEEPPPPPPSDDLIIINPGFDGPNGGSANDWDEVDQGNDVYCWSDAAISGLPEAPALAFKDADGPTYVQQNLSTNNTDLTTESRGEWTVGFKYGWRTNTEGGDAEFTISLIDLDTEAVLSSAIQTVVLTDPTIFNGYTNMGTASLTLDYNNDAAPVGHSIALRIERTDANDGATYKSTPYIDDVTVVALIETQIPATILSITPVGGDVMKIVIDAPSNSDIYWPKAKGNLVVDTWEGVAHSVDGSAPWYVTNLVYVTEFESGTNSVIYVQATDDEKFFGIGGE